MRHETEAAIRAARQAQQIADSRVGADSITFKSGIDPVTATDVACEDAIRAELRAAFPEYPVIGEERGGEPVPGVPYWLVDPICGTRMFGSDIPLYCTNIALVENGVVTVAAVGIGKTGEILYAEKGAGARMRTSAGEDKPIAVHEDSHTIWIDGKTERAGTVLQRALLKRDRWYVCLFPSTVSLAYLATGRIAGMLLFGRPSSIQHGSVHMAAGCLVASEAGAIIIDLATGGGWTLTTRTYLAAATPQMRDDLAELVNTTAR